jgi:hypothetical protein
LTNNIFQIPRSVFDRFPIFRDGADLLGCGLLIAILLFSIWRYLVLRRAEATAARMSAGYADAGGLAKRRSLKLLEFPVAVTGPLLMFGGLAYNLDKLQDAHPELLAQAPWIEYKTCLWVLIAVVALQQIFVIKRLRFDLDTTSIGIGKIAMLALPVTLIVAIAALKKIFFGDIDRLLDDLTLSVSIGSIVGIALSLVYLLNADVFGARSRAVAVPAAPALLTGVTPAIALEYSAAGDAAAEPVKAPERAPLEGAQTAAPAAAVEDAPAIAEADALQATGTEKNPVDEIEAGLQEIAQLLGTDYQPKTAARPDLDLQMKSLEQNDLMEDEISPLVLQHVNRQKALFEKGMPFNLSALVNGLVILNKSVDVHDAATGNTLLHLAVRSGDADLVQTLIESGADAGALNNDGLTAQDLTEDPALRALLLAADLRSLAQADSYSGR